MEYGNPSGHAQNFCICLMIVTLDFLIFFREQRFRMLGRFESWAYKMMSHKFFIAIVMILNVVSIIMVGYSRIFLGVHSFNQILLGWSYATILVVLYFAMFKELIRQMMEYLIDNNNKRGKQLFVVFVVYFICNTISIVLNYIRALDELNNFVYYAYIRGVVMKHGC